MKKLLLAVILSLAFIAPPVFAQSVDADLDAWWAEINTFQEANSAKGAFQTLMTDIDRNLDLLQKMNADGDFDGLPASWRAKALWAWQTLDTARDTVKADAEFMAGIEWRP